MPVPTSAILLKAFDSPHDYIGEDGKKHRKPVRALYGFGESAKERFERDSAEYERYSASMKAVIDADNLAVTFWRDRAIAGHEDAIRWYCQSVMPAVFPTPPGGILYFSSGYSARDRHLVVERWVPDIGVIPLLHRYEIGAHLALRQVAVSDHDLGTYYIHFLAQIALLSVDRIYRSEIATAVDTVTVNCMAVVLNPATGHLEVVCVLSVTVARLRFLSLNLGALEPLACIQSFAARVTGSPGGYEPVTPWVRADATGDVVINVGNTPLLQMDPGQFELLVTELMRRMGLRAERTGTSGDGGVDCVAYDDRPVVGGKVIVQVKRYANTVNPSVVRDLYGTVHATGATKGVLITTSGFGPESREFVSGKPLELVDGPSLDILLRRYQLAGAMSLQPADQSTVQIQQEAPQVSPDGQYYWDGTSWKPIVAGS